MPYQFEYNLGNQVVPHFYGHMHSERCQGHTKTGHRCSRHTIIGIGFCFQHLASLKHLKIDMSGIQNAGKGLFAVGNGIVFRRGDDIIRYTGQHLTDAQLAQRYDDGPHEKTAPYAISAGPDDNIDDALVRSAGSLINQGTRYTNNCKFDERNGAVYVVATKSIRGGQELFVNYGHHYRFGHHPDENTHYRTLKYWRSHW